MFINNAAIMVCPYSKSEDGIELQFATNYIGHFLLVNLLREKILNAGKGVRVVNVSSVGHWFGEVRFEDLNFQVCGFEKSVEKMKLMRFRMGRCIRSGKHMDSLRLP